MAVVSNMLDYAKYHNVSVEDFFPNASSTKEELRAWLVALGVPSARIALKPDFGQIDIIRLEIQGSG